MLLFLSFALAPGNGGAKGQGPGAKANSAACRCPAPASTALLAASRSEAGAPPGGPQLNVATFNLLCPAYRRVRTGDDDVRESQFPALYERRVERILALEPLWSADIVCAQEFWYGSESYMEKMVTALESRFVMHGMQRPRISETVPRPDGLFMAISREWEVLHEADLNFEDAAGRCAQILHLRRVGGTAARRAAAADDAAWTGEAGGPAGDVVAGGFVAAHGGDGGDAAPSLQTGSRIGVEALLGGEAGDDDLSPFEMECLRKPPAGGGEGAESDGIDELIVANVHLLFPHNPASMRIRLREAHKLLCYVDAYKCASGLICLSI